MFEFKIEKVAEVLQEQSKLFNCGLNTAWELYMHDLIKEQFTFQEVFDYITKQ